MTKILPTTSPFSLLCLILTFGWAISGCTPKVEIALSEKPIEINVNINIQHDINMNADKEIDELFKDKDVF